MRQRSTQIPQSRLSRRVPRVLRAMFVAVVVVSPATHAVAHDVERTQVLLTFARDGSFTLDVSNDPNWLKLRLERFDAAFIDRVVLFVDGREIRPTSLEYIPFDSSLTLSPSKGERLARGRSAGLATHRMRGRFPTGARTLRWYYGMVVDPYPLAIRRADGQIVVEEIAGDAWSGSIDLSGQFTAPLMSEHTAVGLVAALLLVPLALRARTWRRASLGAEARSAKAAALRSPP